MATIADSELSSSVLPTGYKEFLEEIIRGTLQLLLKLKQGSLNIPLNSR